MKRRMSTARFKKAVHNKGLLVTSSISIISSVNNQTIEEFIEKSLHF